MNKGLLMVVALTPMISEDVVEPINEPLPIVAGNVITPFKVSEVPPRSIAPFVCAKVFTIRGLPIIIVCPERLNKKLFNVLAVALSWLINIELLITPEPAIVIEEVAEPVKLPLEADSGNVILPFKVRRVVPRVIGPLM